MIEKHNMNAQFEEISPSFGSSFLIQKFGSTQPNQKPNWHYHPELELVYVENGSGKIHVGHHLSYYKSGALVLIGSMVPHLGFVERMTRNETEIVVQFKEDFLGSGFFDASEMTQIKSLLNMSKYGIKFKSHVRKSIGEKLKELCEMNNFNKLIYFLKLLQELSVVKDYELLNATETTMIASPQDNDRLDQIFMYVRNNFDLEIKLDEISALVNMTPQSFCRYFKKTTQKTFLEYVNEFRVVHSTKLMAESNKSITEISYESGFNNKSHFIKQFKKVTSMTPSAYRDEMLLTIG